MLTAAEDDGDVFGHSRSDRALLIGLDREGTAFWGNYGHSLHDRRTVEDPNRRSIALVQLIACKLDFRWFDRDEGVPGCFLKLVCVKLCVHLLVRLWLRRVSLLRTRVVGRKVLLRSRPILASCSFMVV
jgi:hypothetical protein